jgi:hypothetical protein
MKNNLERIILSKKISVTEYCAELKKESEAEWLIKWSEEQGLTEYYGKINGIPELTLVDPAGRVYKVNTDLGNNFFVVVGHGCPTFYPMKKEYFSSKDILCLHRGKGLVTNMKFEYIKEKRKLER